MHYIPQSFDVKLKKVLIDENFKNNKNRWEQVDSDTEVACIHKGTYSIENKTKTRWNYYKINAQLKKVNDFFIEADIKILQSKEYRHAGIIWGFNKEKKHLNRFSISGDGKRISISCFEKDHFHVPYRFQSKINSKSKSPLHFKLSIIKLDDFFYFYLNQQLVNIVHNAHFTNEGSLVGYYLEPELKISSSYIKVNELAAKSIKNDNQLVF